MQRIINTIVLSCTALAGCSATTPAKPPTQITTSPPTCTNTVQCDAMWVRASEILPIITGTRIAQMNTIYMATYPVLRGIPLQAHATKSAVGPDTYEIRATITCRHQDVCGDLPESGTNLFNRAVENAGRR